MKRRRAALASLSLIISSLLPWYSRSFVVFHRHDEHVRRNHRVLLPSTTTDKQQQQQQQQQFLWRLSTTARGRITTKQWSNDNNDKNNHHRNKSFNSGRKTRRVRLSVVAAEVRDLKKEEHLTSRTTTTATATTTTATQSKELIAAIQGIARAETTSELTRWGRRLGQLRNVIHQESPPVRDRIIQMASITGQFWLALDTTESLLRQNHLPSDATQDLLAGGMRRGRRVNRLTQVLKDIGQIAKLQGGRLSINAYNILLAALCESATPKDENDNDNDDNASRGWSPRDPAVQLDTALRLLQIDQTSTFFGLLPDVVSYNTVAAAAAASGNRTLVDAVWEEMKERQVRPDFVTYNAILKSRLSSSSDDEVLRLWREITPLDHDNDNSDAKKSPNRYTLDVILAPLMRSGQMDEATTLLRNFVSTQPKAVCSQAFGAYFKTLVDGCNGSMDSARAIFDTFVLPSIIQTRKASSVLSSYQDNDASSMRYTVTPTTRHFNVLIDGYRKAAKRVTDDEDRWESERLCKEGWYMYKLMQDAGVAVDQYTVTPLMGLCTDPRQLSKLIARSIVHHKLRRTPAFLRAACTAFGDLGDASSACWLLDQNIYGWGDTSRDWNVVLRALAINAAQKFPQRLDIWNSTAAKMLTNPMGINQTKRSSSRSPWSSVDGLHSWDAAQFIVQGHVPAPTSQTYCVLAQTLQYRFEGSNADVARELFRNATARNIPADGRFVNAALRCFGSDIQAALVTWRDEIRPTCLEFENRKRYRPPSTQRVSGKNLVAAYNGLLYVCGRAGRADIALRLVYAMKKEQLEPTEVSLNSFRTGKRIQERQQQQLAEMSSGSRKLGQRLVEKLKMVGAYESLLEVECLKYDQNDQRRENERRVRIIV